MKLEWDSPKCACTTVADVGLHDEPHTAESPWGTYVVEPWGEAKRFHAVFHCNCCDATTVLREGVSFDAAYEATKAHFQEMFDRRMKING
jgi:hypothetical protein